MNCLVDHCQATGRSDEDGIQMAVNKQEFIHVSAARSVFR